jgi:hypothetical protein
VVDPFSAFVPLDSKPVCKPVWVVWSRATVAARTCRLPSLGTGFCRCVFKRDLRPQASTSTPNSVLDGALLEDRAPNSLEYRRASTRIARSSTAHANGPSWRCRSSRAPPKGGDGKLLDRGDYLHECQDEERHRSGAR